MTKILNGIIISSILLLGFIPLSAFAEKPETPNGKPFKEIDAKIAELEAIIAKLRTDSDDNDEAFADALAALDEKTTNKDNELMAKDMQLMDKDAELMDKDAELMDKDMQLMDKDAELMDKDMALMDKDMALMDEDATIINNLNLKIEILSAAMQMDDSVCDNIPNADKVADTTLGQLCDQADVWIANYEALCNNVPLFGDAIGIVDTSVVAVLGASNIALGEVNSVINTLISFNTGFSHNIPDIHVNLGSIDLPLGIGSVSLGSIDIPLPTITIPGITPFSFLATIPSIPGNVIGIVDVKLNQVADCSII